MADATSLGLGPAAPWYSILHSTRRRWAVALWTIAIPVVSFTLSADGFLSPEWQSGTSAGVSALLLEPAILGEAMALVAIGALLVLAVLVAPPLMGHQLVRIGLWFSAATAATFTIVLAVGSGGFSLLLTAVTLSIWAMFFRLRKAAQSALPSFTTDLLLALLFLALLALTAYASVSVLGAGPFVVTAVIISMLRASPPQELHIARSTQFAIVSPTSFLFVAAWYRALQRAVDAYDALPVEPPNDCYVATAATYGHRQLVGSVTTRHGSPVNAQLRQIKAGEIVIKLVAPGAHRSMRVIYDYVGPRIATRCTSPWAADAAFLLLLPFQVCARLLTAALGQSGSALHANVYRSTPATKQS